MLTPSFAPTAKKEHRIGDENSWVIDILQPGDVLVVDLFGKVRYGTFAGDNLSTAIYTKSHNGLIVNGAVRDVTGIQQIPGFQVYIRGVDPSALENVMLTGINVPIRIGDTTVMPGDIALGDPEGITFIPPQLAQKVADDTEMDRLVDEWGHMMLREGKYTPGQIDAKWTREMVGQFNQWLAKKGSNRRMPQNRNAASGIRLPHCRPTVLASFRPGVLSILASVQAECSRSTLAN